MGVSPDENTPHAQQSTNGSQHPAGNSNGVSRMTRTETSELQDCHRTIAQLEARCSRLEGMSSEFEGRLERQEETMIRAESNAKKSKEMYQDRIRKYEESIKDLVSVVRTKDRQIQRMEEKHIENKEDLRRVLQKKHEIVAQAKREERESIRDQERAARDIRNMSSSSYGATNGEPRGDPVRRTPSSGTLFAKAHSSGGRYGGVAGGIAGGGRLGGAGDRVAGVLPDQVRKTCVEKSMTDFFHMT